MKGILMFFSALATLTGCRAKQTTIDLDYGFLHSLTAQGAFGTKGERDTYFYWGIDHAFKQRYILLNIERGTGEDIGCVRKAYMLLDSLDLARKMGDVDLEHSQFPANERIDIQKVIDRRPRMQEIFNAHVKVIVEKDALASGISYHSRLVWR